MSDSYCLFSEEITDLTDDEMDWLAEALSFDPEAHGGVEAPKWYDTDGGGYRFESSLERSTREFNVYSEEMGDVDQVAFLVQAFLVKFRPNDVWTMEWAYTSSRPLVGEFGGGALAVTSKEIRSMTTSEWAQGIHRGEP